LEDDEGYALDWKESDERPGRSFGFYLDTNNTIWFNIKEKRFGSW